MSFRPTFKPQTNWRQREQERETARKEAERKAVEEAERKQYARTETNFPSMSSVRPVGPVAVGDNSFAQLAEKWKNDSDTEKKLEEYRKTQEERDRRELVNGVFVYRPKPKERRLSEEYRYDEDETAAPVSAPVVGVATGMNVDETGWTEVSRRVRKSKRELTMAEIEDKYRETPDDTTLGWSEEGLNGDLFDSKRHDHDRV